MKWDGRWDQLKGRIKEEWGMLTDDDLKRIEGRRDRLVGVLKERTGEALDVVEEKVRAFEKRMGSDSTGSGMGSGMGSGTDSGSHRKRSREEQVAGAASR